MGAYLERPITEKISDDNSFGKLKYGACSMQGWRISQEDAHNCCLEFDKDASLFAVYDGHGGSEVAEYTADKFPDFIKSVEAYKSGNMGQALEDAFLQFDATLLREDIVQKLTELAGMNIDEEDQDDEEEEKLKEEADMPIEELMKRYGYSNQNTDSTDEPERPTLAKLRALCKKENYQSPMIRAKKDQIEENGEGIPKKEDVKMNLDDELGNEAQLVNGHSEKMNGAPPMPDSSEASAKTETIKSELKVKDGSEVTPSEATPGEVTCSSSDSGIALDSNNKMEDSGVSSSTAETLGSSSSADVSSSSGGSAGGSSSSGGSAGGSSSLAAVSSEAGCGGSSQDDPSSSSGRTRKKRSGVIPAEGEDETSDDEEDTDEEDDSDEEVEPWKSGSDDENDSEEEEGLEGPFAEDEEEEDEIMCGGEEPGMDSGCTAVVALLHKSQLYVANAGDSRCILCRGGETIELSFDHKPEDEVERNRIEHAGGRITRDGRVNGGLNLSRAIGDHRYKQNTSVSDREQMISPLPDIKTATIGKDDEFMVLACDGIWNMLGSKEVVNFVRDRLKAGVPKLSQICEELFITCLAPNTHGTGIGCDNMTCVIVTFGNHFPLLEESNLTKASVAVTNEASKLPEVIAQSSSVNSSDNKTDISTDNSTVSDSMDSESSIKRKADDNVDSTDSKRLKTD